VTSSARSPWQPTLAPGEVRGLWAHMADHFGTKVVDKRSALEMRLVARFLDAIGVLDRNDFLDGYATTIGRRIYLPFDVGVGDEAELWHQILLCVHEHQHVVQHDRRGIRYEIGYLTDRTERARLEAEAYRCDLELSHWRWGTLPDARELAEKLGSYGCRPTDIDLAERMLRIWSVPIRHGAVLGEASQVAVAWLNEHVPHLRGSGE
jgi:hypothetical protein